MLLREVVWRLSGAGFVSFVVLFFLGGGAYWLWGWLTGYGDGVSVMGAYLLWGATRKNAVVFPGHIFIWTVFARIGRF